MLRTKGTTIPFGSDSTGRCWRTDGVPTGTPAPDGVDAKTRYGAGADDRARRLPFNGHLVYDTKAWRLVGVHYETDALGTLWKDPPMKATQVAINAMLPGR